jgi:hypothetical protein
MLFIECAPVLAGSCLQQPKRALGFLWFGLLGIRDGCRLGARAPNGWGGSGAGWRVCSGRLKPALASAARFGLGVR